VALLDGNSRSRSGGRLSASAAGPARAADLRVFALLLAIIVVIPLLGVAVLGGRMLELGPVEIRSQQSKAASETLLQLGDRTRLAVDLFAVRAEERIDKVITHAGGSFNLAVADHTIDLAVIYDENGRRLFPATGDALFTPFERQLAKSAFAPLDTARTLLILQSEGDKSTAETWTLVGSPVGLSPARCWHGRQREVACVVFDRAAMTSAVVGALDEFVFDKSDLDFVLIDEAGAMVWPAIDQPAGVTLATRPLSAPWSAWRLEARLTGSSPAVGPSWNGFAAAMVAMLAAIGGLAGYIFWSQRSRLEASHRRAAEAAQISHELRTPLTNLGLYGELIRARAGGDAAITEYCDVLDSETKRLGALVEDATAIVRGRARAVPRLHTGVPDDVACHTLTHFRPMLETAGGRVELRGKADALLRFDRVAFERIMINFLDNARKYAPGSQIDVETWMDGVDLYLAVRDHGRGIPAQIADVIFDPLVRADGGPEGYGLGLASCRRLARANGGDVGVEDGRPGARFVAWMRTEPGPAGT